MQNNCNNPIVTIRCWTFNHKPYIRQCLDGFVIQKTNFPYFAVVVDDTSTDGEQEVLWDFINNELDPTSLQKDETDDFVRVVAPHKTNKHCIFIFILLKYNHYSIRKAKRPYFKDWEDKTKFITFCEGDDYWISPYKLQKQVDLLLNDDKIGLVFTKDFLLNEISGKKTERSLSPEIELDDNFKWKILDQSVMIGTNSTMLRRNLYQQIVSIKEDFEGFLMGDTQLWFHSARLSKVAYIPEAMSVYRKQPTGATGVFNLQKRITFLNGCLDLDLHLAYKYGAPKESIHKIMKVFFVQIYSLYLQTKDYTNAQMLSKRIISNAWLMKPFCIITKIAGRFPSTYFRKIFDYLDRKGIIKYRY